MAYPYGDWLCIRAEGKGFIEGQVYKCKKDNTGGPRIYPYEGSNWAPYWSKEKGRFCDDRFRFKYTGDKQMKYETGRWHPWDGKGECPFDKEKTDYYITAVDASSKGFFTRHLEAGEKYNGVNVYHKNRYGGFWNWQKYSSGDLNGHASVLAFYIVSYNEPKEMTVAEIEKELGYSVKVVK